MSYPTKADTVRQLLQEICKHDDKVLDALCTEAQRLYSKCSSLQNKGVAKLPSSKARRKYKSTTPGTQEQLSDNTVHLSLATNMIPSSTDCTIPSLATNVTTPASTHCSYCHDCVLVFATGPYAVLPGVGGAQSGLSGNGPPKVTIGRCC
jgi:hypothetical protein